MRDSCFPERHEPVSPCGQRHHCVPGPGSKPSARIRALGPHAPRSTSTTTGTDGQALIRNLHLGPAAAVAVVRLSDWRLCAISRGLESQLRYLPAELDDASLSDVLANPDDSTRIAESLTGEGRPESIPLSLLNAEGEPVSALAWGLRLDAGDEATLLMVFTPMPNGEAMAAVSGQDPVTGLGARRHFSERLVAALIDADRQQALVGCLLVQLDEFETAYSENGEAFGEEPISVIARRLQRTVRSYDTVARLGADRLGIVVERLDSPVEALRAAQHVNRALAEPISVPGACLRPRVVIGVAVYPTDAGSVRGLLRRANAAMYTARRRGEGNVVSAVTPS